MGKQGNQFKRELLSGTTSLVLLALLEANRTPMYGYDVIGRVEDLAGGEMPFRAGTLYAALRGLERKGLLKSSIVPSAAGPPRKYYRVTAAGRGWLAGQRRQWATLVEALGRLGVDVPDAPGGGPERAIP